MIHSALPDHGDTFDESAQRFMETNFDETPEGVSEALHTGDYTVLVSRDP